METLPRLVIIGNGMVGHRLVDRLISRGATARWQVTVFCEEPRLAYDRVNLSSVFDGKTAEDLAMARLADYQDAGIEVLIGDRAAHTTRAQTDDQTSRTGNRHESRSGGRPAFVEGFRNSCQLWRRYE